MGLYHFAVLLSKQISGDSIFPPMAEEVEPDPRLVDQHKRVVLPDDVMERLDLETGDYVAFEEEGGKVWLRKVTWSME